MDDEEGKPLSLSREDLYELAWSKPISELAKDFGISDVALGKRCRRLGIPIPGRGYWARLDAGQKPYKPSLPKRETQWQDHQALTVTPPAEPVPVPVGEISAEAQQALDAAWLTERTAFEERADNVIEIPDTLRTWDPAIRALRDKLEQSAKGLRASKLAFERYEKWPESRKARESCREAWNWQHVRNSGERIWDSHKSVAFRVSLGSYQRALKITNALAIAAQSRGFEVRDDENLGRVVFAGYEAEVKLRITEQLDERTRPRVRYDGKTESERYMKPTSRLRISIQTGHRDGPNFEDRGTVTLESQLNKVFTAMYRMIVRYWVWKREIDARHRQFEEDCRRREEAERLREGKARLAAEERSRRKALIAEAQRWSTARILSDYLSHIRGAALPRADSPSTAWFDWALQVAAELDPTASRLSDTAEVAAPASDVEDED